MTEDKFLIRKIRGGDPKSFKILYDRYVSQIHAFVLRWLKSESLADDITQDTFLKLWIRRECLDENKSVKSYLFTISYRRIIKELKRQVKNPLMGDYLEFVNEAAVNHMHNYDFEKYLKIIDKAKSELSPRQREIYILNKECGLTVAQIAERFGIQAQVVSNQLCAALKIIRNNLL